MPLLVAEKTITFTQILITGYLVVGLFREAESFLS